MNNNKATHNVSRDVSMNDKMSQNAMLNAIGMRKTEAWVQADKPEQKNALRKDRYRRKLAVNGIRQLNIQVPDSEYARGTFNKLAYAVCNDQIETDKLAALAEDPEKADIALKIISIAQKRTVFADLLWGLLTFLVKWQSKRPVVTSSTHEG